MEVLSISTPFFYYSANKLQEEHEKQKHNSMMKEVYTIIQKIKKMGKNERLTHHEMRLIVE
jgi:hypothetical protein